MAARKTLKKHKRTNQTRALLKPGLVFLGLLLLVLAVIKIHGAIGAYRELKGADIDASKPDINVQLLDVNAYSRPGTKTGKIKNLVIHYTANPGSSAMDNRNYFQGLKDSHQTKASSNFVVGIQGEIVQCVPTWEMAYASNSRNKDSVSIEFCHSDASGKPAAATYNSLVQLCAWLNKKFGLTSEDIIRHYDVTGKICPKYFVDNPQQFRKFKDDVKTAMAKGD